VKTLKRILAVALALFAAVLLVIISLYLLVDDTTLFARIVKQVESSSDIRVLHRGDVHITRTLRPTLTVDNLVVGDVTRQYQAKAASLEVQISLPRLLLRQLDIPHLIIGNTHIEIKEGESPSKTRAEPQSKAGPKQFPLPFMPVLHDARISRVEIIRRGSSVSLPEVRVREFTLKLKPDNTVESSGQVVFDHQQVAVKILLSDEDAYFAGKPLAFSVGMQSAMLALSVEGQVDFAQKEPLVEATVRGWTPDADKPAKGKRSIEIPGKLNLAAQLKGTFSKLPMEGITATYRGPRQSNVELKGNIANLIKLEGVQLDLTGKLDELAWLTTSLPESLGAIRNANFSAKISGDYPLFAVRDFDFQGITEEGLDLSLSGKFDLAKSLEPVNIQAKVLFAAPTTRAARFLLFDAVPEFGAITGKCDVHSTVGDPALMNIVVQTKDRNIIQTNLSGGIAQFPLADRPNKGYDLDVSMQATEGAVLAKRVGLELPEFGPLNLNFRIQGSTQALQLNHIKLAGGKEDDVRMNAQGQMSFGDWDQPDPFKTIDLKLQAQSHTTQLLSPWVGEKMPELGSLQAEAHLHTVSGKHRLDQVEINTGKTAPLKLTVSGSAGKVILLPELSVQEIKLEANVSTDDTGKLNTVFGFEDKIPPFGPLEGQAQISGDEQNLVIDEVSVSAGKENLLLIKLNGTLGTLSPANKWRPQNTDLAIQASSSSSRALAETLGYNIPELGPLSARANILGKKKKLSLDSAQLRLGEVNDPVVIITGYINDLFAMKGVKGDGRLHLDGHHFAAFADFAKLPDLGTLNGRMKISDSNGTMGIDSLKIESTQPGLLSLKVDGRFDNFMDPSTLQLNSSLSAKDLELLGALFDRQWPAIGPVQLDSQIKRSGKGKEFDTTLTAGQTEVEVKLDGVFDTTPMHISGTIRAKKMLVYDLFERESKGKKKKPPKKEPVFSHEPIDFGWLKKADVDVAIAVESFAKEQFLAKSAQFQVTIKSGVLSINPARFVYPKGKLDMDLELDGREHPRLTFKASGENLDPHRALDTQAYKKELKGSVNIDLSFSTSGLTPHDMAANSQGSIYITMQNGKLSAPLADLVFWDVAGWAWKKATDQKYYDISCGVADFTIDKGVISTKAFILDSKNITITGGGTIDLGREHVEYVLVPKKKSLQFIEKADPVDIKGPLADPKVSTLPLKSATKTAITVGAIVLAPLAPWIVIPAASAWYLAGKVNIENGESACLEYQKAHEKEEGQQLNKAPDTTRPPPGEDAKKPGEGN
jgi:uncharacterized protein involved in outer membrane biogenesis